METPIKSAQYQHLSSIERVQIMLFQRQGLSMNAIACELKRAASTISRELRRHRYVAICPTNAAMLARNHGRIITVVATLVNSNWAVLCLLV